MAILRRNVMSNDINAINRLFKLQAKINMMVVDGTRDAESVADALQRILEERQSYLRHLETINLIPTKGEATLAKAKQSLTGWIDGDFKNLGTDVGGEDTTETKVDVHEMTRNGNFQTLFCSLGDPRKLCLTQGQIEEFCHSHRDSLRQEGYGTFFLFEVKGELFVAYVFVDVGKLRARVHRFGNGYVLDADFCHRLVVRQRTV